MRIRRYGISYWQPISTVQHRLRKFGTKLNLIVGRSVVWFNTRFSHEVVPALIVGYAGRPYILAAPVHDDSLMG